MKIFLYALILVGLLSQCAEEKTTPAQISGKLNQEFTLKPGQSILLAPQSEGSEDSSKAIKALLIEATDSLCPEGLDCIIAGSAKVILQVAKGQYSDTLYLCLADCSYSDPNSPFKSDSTHFQLGAASYVATFKQIHSKGKRWDKKVQGVTLLVESK